MNTVPAVCAGGGGESSSLKFVFRTTMCPINPAGMECLKFSALRFGRAKAPHGISVNPRECPTRYFGIEVCMVILSGRGLFVSRVFYKVIIANPTLRPTGWIFFLFPLTKKNRALEEHRRLGHATRTSCIESHVAYSAPGQGILTERHVHIITETWCRLQKLAIAVMNS